MRQKNQARRWNGGNQCDGKELKKKMRTDSEHNTKHSNIQIIGAPEEEEKDKGPKEIFWEIIEKKKKKLPYMEMEIVTQV